MVPNPPLAFLGPLAPQGHVPNFDETSQPSPFTDAYAPGGRLSVTSGTPVTTADTTGSTLYYVADRDARISLWDGSRFVRHRFAVDAPDLRSRPQINASFSMSAGSNYDVFVYFDPNNGYQLAQSAGWTNDTTRADALGFIHGVPVNAVPYAGCPAGFGLWVGTFRGTASFFTDTAAQRFLWNRYNQQPRYMNVSESTANWNYTTATWRQTRASTSNKVEYVTGDAATLAQAKVSVIVSQTGQVFCASGVGVDSTTTNSAQDYGTVTPNGSFIDSLAFYSGYPGLGYHALNWLEYSNVGGVTTWHSNEAAWLPNTAGMNAVIWG